MEKYISGITFIKNGLSLGYPIKESVESILPFCDEIIINVGFDNPELTGDDGTWEYLNDTFKGPQFKFLKSWWDPAKRKNGLILRQVMKDGEKRNILMIFYFKITPTIWDY